MSYDIKILRDSDINAIMKSEIVPMKFKIAWLISIKDGLRKGEIVNLRLEHLEFENDAYRLETQKNGIKNGIAYMCHYVKKHLLWYVERYKDQIEKHNNYIIYSQQSKTGGFTSEGFGVMIWKYTKRLGIRRVYAVNQQGNKLVENSFHAARHRGSEDYAYLMMLDKKGRPFKYWKKMVLESKDE